MLVCRELYGRGWISWAKTSQVWRSLQQAQNRAAAQGAAGSDLTGAAIPLQVELLTGQVGPVQLAAAAFCNAADPKSVLSQKVIQQTVHSAQASGS